MKNGKRHERADREHHLQLYGGTNPGPGFIKKYGLAAGKKLPATLMLIVRGTCSPVVFEFEGIDLKDHAAN